MKTEKKLWKHYLKKLWKDYEKTMKWQKTIKNYQKNQFMPEEHKLSANVSSS